MSVPNPYKQASVNTAPPSRLLLMLFDGLLRFIHQGEMAIKAKQAEEAHKALLKAQDIVLELRSTLDKEKAPELCETLYDLYTYFYQKLIEANTKKDAQPLQEIEGFIKELRDAFQQAERKLAGERQGDSNANLA